MWKKDKLKKMNSSSVFVRFYQKISKDYMTLLHSFEAGCLMCTGDLIAQTVIEEKKFKNVDKMRSAQFFTLGAVIVVRYPEIINKY